MRRELARSHSSLRLEEHRNRDLPMLERIASSEEYDRRFNAAVTEYMEFLQEAEIHSMRDYMDAALSSPYRQLPASRGPSGVFLRGGLPGPGCDADPRSPLD